MNGLPWIVAVAAVTDKYADRQHSVMSRAHYLFGWGFVAVCVALLLGANRTASGGASAGAGYGPSDAGGAGAEEIWWRRVRPYCNAVEVRVVQRESAPPATTRGAGYHAACFALAGQIDEARRIIDALAPNERYRAAEIVFEVGHPVADAGDDRSAAPIMELVIDYWPNHYMALYHAGMAEYMLGQRALAKKNLTEFLRLYHENDGWRANGLTVLARLDSAAPSDLRRPAEP
jgi:tetratricopeptide (TPR) repeat protein